MAGGSNLPDRNANRTRGNQDGAGNKSNSMQFSAGSRGAAGCFRGAITPHWLLGRVMKQESGHSRMVVRGVCGLSRRVMTKGKGDGLHKGRLRYPLPLVRQRLRQRLCGKTRSRGCLKLGAPFSHARLAEFHDRKAPAARREFRQKRIALLHRPSNSMAGAMPASVWGGGACPSAWL